MTREETEDKLEHAEKLRTILDMRAEGRPWPEIAVRLGVSERTCHRVISDAAEQSNARNQSLVDEMRLTHNERCEFLYRRVVEKLNEQFKEGVLDEKLLRAAVLVMDRQARLLGLDAVKIKGVSGRNDWVDELPLSKVISEAERFGIQVPKELRTPQRIPS